MPGGERSLPCDFRSHHRVVVFLGEVGFYRRTPRIDCTRSISFVGLNGLVM